jgi:hypothetical protein
VAVVLLGLVLFSFKAVRLGAKDAYGLGLALSAGIMLAVSLYFDTMGAREPVVQRSWGAEYIVVTIFLSCVLGAGVGEFQGLIREILRDSRRGKLEGSMHKIAAAISFRVSSRALTKGVVFSFLAACAALASIALVLWAYAQGPTWLVASLRESNIVFAGLLAVWWLGERIRLCQWLAIGVTAFGAIIIKNY